MAELKRAKVKLLVDTRAVAASRKPGFSKRQLAAALDEEGIAYLHLQKLGTPDEGRAGRARRQARHALAHLRQALKTPEAIEAMDELVSIVKSGQPVCLLCYERDKDCCHRTPHRRDRARAHRRKRRRSGAGAVLSGYSAGCDRPWSRARRR